MLIATGATVVLASAVIVYSIRQESGEARDPGYEPSATTELGSGKPITVEEPSLPASERRANEPGSPRSASGAPSGAASPTTAFGADSRDAGIAAPPPSSSPSLAVAPSSPPDASSSSSSSSSSHPPSPHGPPRAAHAGSARDAGAPSRPDAAPSIALASTATSTSTSSAVAAPPPDGGAPRRPDAGRPLPGRVIGGGSADPNAPAASNAPAPSHVESTALARKFAALERSRTEEEGALRQVDRFVPTGGITLAGRVIDADVGKPIVGTLVHVHHEGTLVEGVTDAQGAFHLPGMPTGGHVVLWVGRAGDPYIDERLELAVPAAGESIDAGTVKLLRGDELSGRSDGWVGLFVNRRGGQIVVAGVSPWTPADQEGLEVGDQLISIDGRDVTGLGPRAVTYMLRGRVGGSVAVVVRAHGGQKRKVALARVVR